MNKSNPLSKARMHLWVTTRPLALFATATDRIHSFFEFVPPLPRMCATSTKFGARGCHTQQGHPCPCILCHPLCVCHSSQPQKWWPLNVPPTFPWQQTQKVWNYIVNIYVTKINHKPLKIMTEPHSWACATRSGKLPLCTWRVAFCPFLHGSHFVFMWYHCQRTCADRKGQNTSIRDLKTFASFLCPPYSDINPRNSNKTPKTLCISVSELKPSCFAKWLRSERKEFCGVTVVCHSCEHCVHCHHGHTKADWSRSWIPCL